LVIRDLLSIARINEWHVYHYRDNSDLEIDVIIEKSYQQWAALEIKLGTIELEKTCKKMILFKNKIIRNGGTKPQFLAIVVGVGATYHKTKEGIHIIPIDCLN
jgi:hypothetical protein